MIRKSRALGQLMALLKTPGPSGGESAVARLVKEQLVGFGCRKAWIRHDKAHEKIGEGPQVALGIT